MSYGCLYMSYFIFIVFFILLLFYMFFFFVSSRRRHTRLVSDWSSDVCSSDLAVRGKESVHRLDPEAPTAGARPRSARRPETGAVPVPRHSSAPGCSRARDGRAAGGTLRVSASARAGRAPGRVARAAPARRG